MPKKAEKIKRASVKSMDAVLGKTYKILDDGFIRVIDYMGSDAAIVQAARVSYGAGTKQVNEDRGLIRYLMRHLHTTPFEMCEIKFHIRVPMDAWRQWIRHRTANVNEYSTRYSVAIDSAQRTKPDQWRKQSLKNKQGSEDFFDAVTGKKLTEEETALQSQIRSVYDKRLSVGVAREQARKELPLSTYTEAYWKIDLHNLLHFLYLRMDPSAQYEIRCYAEIIGNEIVSRWCPLTWEAFLDYRLEAQRMSRIELEIIRLIGSGHPEKAVDYAVERGLIDKSGALKRNREREELEEKLRNLNINIPW